MRPVAPPQPAPVWLYVPGDNGHRIEKALGAGADRVVIDLEDSVAEEVKDHARHQVAAVLRTADAPCWCG